MHAVPRHAARLPPPCARCCCACAQPASGQRHLALGSVLQLVRRASPTPCPCPQPSRQVLERLEAMHHSLLLLQAASSWQAPGAGLATEAGSASMPPAAASAPATANGEL